MSSDSVADSEACDAESSRGGCRGEVLRVCEAQGRCVARAATTRGSRQENPRQGRLLLDVVVGERAAVLELLAGEDETLLIRGDA